MGTAPSSDEPWISSATAPAYFAVDVQDVDEAIAWYTRALAVDLLDDNTADDGRWRIANLGSDALSIELIFDRRSQERSDGARHNGLAKVGVSVPDVRPVADRVEADTGERPRVVEFEPHGIRLIQLHDPEGNVIQLHSPLSEEVRDEDILLRMHRDILRYHIENDLDAWMAGESEDYVSANRGAISRPTIDERRGRLQPYLDTTTFSKYEDLVDPVVRVSDDGTLGWVICQVEMAGAQGEEEFSSVWAWVELYAKKDGTWRRVGNVSNSRE